MLEHDFCVKKVAKIHNLRLILNIVQVVQIAALRHFTFLGQPDPHIYQYKPVSQTKGKNKRKKKLQILIFLHKPEQITFRMTKEFSKT